MQLTHGHGYVTAADHSEKRLTLSFCRRSLQADEESADRHRRMKELLCSVHVWVNQHSSSHVYLIMCVVKPGIRHSDKERTKKPKMSEYYLR